MSLKMKALNFKCRILFYLLFYNFLIFGIKTRKQHFVASKTMNFLSKKIMKLEIKFLFFYKLEQKEKEYS